MNQKTPKVLSPLAIEQQDCVWTDGCALLKGGWEFGWADGWLGWWAGRLLDVRLFALFGIRAAFAL